MWRQWRKDGLGKWGKTVQTRGLEEPGRAWTDRRFYEPLTLFSNPLRGRRLSKELEQRLGRRLRRLLGEIVPAVDGKAAHIGGPLAPDGERAVGLGRDAAGGTPDRE